MFWHCSAQPQVYAYFLFQELWGIFLSLQSKAESNAVEVGLYGRAKHTACTTVKGMKVLSMKRDLFLRQPTVFSVSPVSCLILWTKGAVNLKCHVCGYSRLYWLCPIMCILSAIDSLMVDMRAYYWPLIRKMVNWWTHYTAAVSEARISEATVADSREHLSFPRLSQHLARTRLLLDKYSFTSSSPLWHKWDRRGGEALPCKGTISVLKRNMASEQKGAHPLSFLAVGSVPFTPFHSPLIHDGANSSRWLVISTSYFGQESVGEAAVFELIRARKDWRECGIWVIKWWNLS